VTSHLREVAGLFLRLGSTAFGGPAAHVAMMRREVVQRRQWVSDGEFVDAVGLTNLLPGPNSTELAIHLGRERAGLAGLFVGGACFIAPAVAIVLVLAVLYDRYGTTVAGERLLYGIKPVIIAIVVHALVGLARVVLRRRSLVVVIAAAVGLSLAGVNEIVLLLGSGVLVTLVSNVRRTPPLASVVPFLFVAPLQLAASEDPNRAAVSLWRLLLIFLKIGALLFGSGYVLLAFLRRDLVDATGWLTSQQLLDAVAVGQFTPGPLFSSATFVGYQVAGFDGAAVATLGIFAPSFAFIALTGTLLARVRRSPLASAALDGVNAAAVGLMAAVTIQLGDDALVDTLTVVMAIASLAVLVRWPINSAWLVLAVAIVGLLRAL
jgi:chromate transporter